jgi:hypothetical protein
MINAVGGCGGGAAPLPPTSVIMKRGTATVSPQELRQALNPAQ